MGLFASQVSGGSSSVSNLETEYFTTATSAVVFDLDFVSYQILEITGWLRSSTSNTAPILQLSYDGTNYITSSVYVGSSAHRISTTAAAVAATATKTGFSCNYADVFFAARTRIDYSAKLISNGYNTDANFLNMAYINAIGMLSGSTLVIQNESVGSDNTNTSAAPVKARLVNADGSAFLGGRLQLIGVPK